MLLFYAAKVLERMTLVEWLANNYKSFGAALEFVTDRSQVITTDDDLCYDEILN